MIKFTAEYKDKTYTFDFGYEAYIMASDNDVRIVEKTELSVVDAVQQNAQRLGALDEDNAEDFVPVIPQFTPQQTQQDTPEDMQNVTKNTIRMQIFTTTARFDVITQNTRRNFRQYVVTAFSEDFPSTFWALLP